MAVWYDKLYTGQNASLIYDRIYKSVEEEQYVPGIYLITLSRNPVEQLEIYDSIQLVQPAFKKRLMPIIGIAAGKEEAMKLFVNIASDVLKKTNGLQIRRYFEERI